MAVGRARQAPGAGLDLGSGASPALALARSPPLRGRTTARAARPSSLRCEVSPVGVTDHPRQDPLGLPTRATDRATGVRLPARDDVPAEVDPQLPGIASWAEEPSHRPTSVGFGTGVAVEPGPADRPSRKTSSDLGVSSSPNGIRTRAATLRGWCPRPLDDGASSGAINLPAAREATNRRPSAGPVRAAAGAALVRFAGRKARGRGLEPLKAGPEPAVLPITPPPKGQGAW